MASPGLMENEKEQKEKKNNNLPLQHRRWCRHRADCIVVIKKACFYFLKTCGKREKTINPGCVSWQILEKKQNKNNNLPVHRQLLTIVDIIKVLQKNKKKTINPGWLLQDWWEMKNNKKKRKTTIYLCNTNSFSRWRHHRWNILPGLWYPSTHDYLFWGCKAGPM